MNTLTMISMAMCAALTVRLMFFSDAHRQGSRWYWRVVLFLVTLYCAARVVDFLYYPEQPTSIWLVLLHTALLFGAFLIRPQYLPWNGYDDLSIQARRLAYSLAYRLRFGVWYPGVYRQQGQAQGGKHRPNAGPQRFR